MKLNRNQDYFLIKRHLFRIVSLTLFFTPLLVIFPIAYFWSSFEELWWRWMMWTLQRSGPTFIKLGQWASTRRDIFAKDFCDRVSIIKNVLYPRKKLISVVAHISVLEINLSIINVYFDYYK